VSEPAPTAVVDLDGVVADVRHRLHHVTGRGAKDWPAFFAAAGDDPLLDEGARTVHALAGVYDIVYLSGRPERLRTTTEQWLRRHGLPPGPLVLRPDRDFRPARRYKLEALALLAETRTVALLVDDDPRVLEDARQAGYDVLPATWMGEQPGLHEAQERDGRT
jgi:phosphoglycolate phosphatase-like HAD superfamily hydrolase